ncbi:Piwi-domain-containing protein [Atractiella rhizophila]|nr:Piwi-domain-containing protein [Atractiella rhizophila]
MNLEDKSLTNEQMGFKGLALMDGITPRPAGNGTAGRPVDILANVFLTTFATTIVYHYDIVIHRHATKSTRPDPTSTNVPRERAREVWSLLEDQHGDFFGPAWVFDGRSNAWTLKKMDVEGEQKKRQWIVEIPRQPGEDDDGQKGPNEFVVKVAFAGQVDLQSLNWFIQQHPNARGLREEVAKSIQALDVLMKHERALKPNTVVGARGEKFFTATRQAEQDPQMRLSRCGVVLRGLFQSMRPSRAGMILNLDSAYSPFLTSGRLTDCIGKILERTIDPSSRLRPSDIEELRRRLHNAKVRVTHRVTSDTFRITGFGKLPSEEKLTSTKKTAGPTPTQAAAAAAAGQKIAMASKQTVEGVSVEVFFRNKYNTQLRYRQLPCARIGKRDLIPIECLELLSGQPIAITAMGKDDPAAMIKIAAKRPPERRQQIEHIRNTSEFEQNLRLQSWNVRIAPNMLKLQGRILPPPTVSYHPSSKAKNPRINNGSWNLIDARVSLSGQPLERWAILNLAKNVNDQQIQTFFKRLIAMCKVSGLDVRREAPMGLHAGDSNSILDSLKQACKKVIDSPTNQNNQPPQILFIVLNEPAKKDIIKRDAFFNLPVPVVTQVLLAKHARQEDARRMDQYCANVALKVNVKLGGCNWTLPPLPHLDNKTMLVGADVTHPPAVSRGDEVPPSIAAVVSDNNTTHTQFSTEIREQKGRQELIEDLKDMITRLSNRWAKNAGGPPQKMIFYRDGVSEGQYSQVVEWEVRQIKEALPEVKLVYIVCGKRHHVRFFAEHDKDLDRTGNLSAGLVVDDKVTHPFIWDFYLQAHAGLQGTARPTHYICLLDEVGFTADQVEKLTHDLCYSYARATKAVSLVPVAYYADVVCEKARAFVYNPDGSTVVSADFDPKRIQARLDRAGGVPGMWWM